MIAPTDRTEVSLTPTGELARAMWEEFSEFTHYLNTCDADKLLSDEEYEFWLTAARAMTDECLEAFNVS